MEFFQQLILILGHIVGFVDGRTIQVQENTGKPVTVKLACITVPEITGQRKQAEESLRKILVPNTPVIVKTTESVQNGSTLGEVFVDNKSINLRMVEEGAATVELKTLNNCFESRSQYLIAEATAKNKRLGLWRQSKVYSLRGKLIYKEIPPVMSQEAYLGEEFFLITDSRLGRKMVLRPSEQVSRTQLQSFHNQQVEIQAVFVEGTRPSQGSSACPIDINAQCLPQGAGYRVLSIKSL
ncbi:hypothetical protein DSM106972_092610 [Dulcicalothrix desertica PCC 7102]|uniref:TNase-like domain-containing protein n=2 Tax=Dulcicalothrix desertica TaxID=32056 RepID=A0A3S1ALA5_9CYAN|nr:hypothetical protein DSM106972_092610 [Dulcicalothrix desertica PCC 7102]